MSCHADVYLVLLGKHVDISPPCMSQSDLDLDLDLDMCAAVCLLGLGLLAVSLPVLQAAPASSASADVCDFQPKCPAKQSAMLANPCPGSCQKYFECVKGEAVARMCLPWENFHPELLQCVFWDMVDCTWSKPSPAPEAPTAAPATEPPATEPPATLAPTVAPLVPGCSFVPECPATGSANLGIPCEKSCRSYVECKEGSYTKQDCALFKKFDTVSGRCVWYGAACAA